MPSVKDRLVHAWNAFRSGDRQNYRNYGDGYYYRPDRIRYHTRNERSIITAIYNRIAIDVSSVSIRHVRTDENDRYLEEIKSGLNNCLSLEANLDQSGRELIKDAVMSMCDEGVVAIVPVDTNVSPINGSYDILSLRVGKVVQWYPKDVGIDLYNDETGQHETIILPKKTVAIIENPLYAVMNEPNSMLQRLIRKLALLDAIDEENSSKKLDLIIQLPYIIKTEARRQQAEQRRKDIEMQLSSSQYGIAYTDGTERITQLNRPLENNLLAQIEYLTTQVYAQLGMSKEIFEGTADEKVMLNYYSRTIEPILTTITDAMRRKFLTKTARTQHQTVMFFREVFKLTPVDQIAEIADKFTRNEILSSNEVRAIIGFKPSNDPRSDELVNKNMPQATEEIQNGGESVEQEAAGADEGLEEPDTSAVDELDSQIEELEKQLEEGDEEIDELEQSANEDEGDEVFSEFDGELNDLLNMLEED